MISREEIEKRGKEWNKQFRKEQMKRFFIDLANRALAGVIGGILAGFVLYYLIWSNK